MMRFLLPLLPLLLPIVSVSGSGFLGASPSDNSFGRAWTMRTPTALLAYSDGERKLSEADVDRLLLSEPALNAFIVAEMRHFVTETMDELDRPGYSRRRWRMSHKDKVGLGLIHEDGTKLREEYSEDMEPQLAVDLICNATEAAFFDGFHEEGLLSALGSAILYFRDYYRTPALISACERVGLSDYSVAHHITDMYHHRTFRGAYTKTLAPSGKGEEAARIAVGLPPLSERGIGDDKDGGVGPEEEEEDDDDECLVWSPTTPGVCLHWKSEDAAWRKRRFERIQMEGTKDPRRGGSGTTR